MSAIRRPLLLASIHDVSPRFESGVDRLIDLLQPHVGSRIAMLVVPNHWGDAPIVPGSPFAGRLRRWADDGAEIFLHGFYHRDTSKHDAAGARLRARFMTAGEGEFLGLSRSDAHERIARGRSLLEDVIGRPIDGFVAPAWLYGSASLEALRECCIPLAEDHFRVWSPTSGRQLARGPVITWASRTKLRLLSSLAAAAALRHAPLDVLRIGVHPPDVRHQSLVRSIDKTFRAAARKRDSARYSDLLQSA
jgi:predicted deacetylase